MRALVAALLLAASVGAFARQDPGMDLQFAAPEDPCPAAPRVSVKMVDRPLAEVLRWFERQGVVIRFWDARTDVRTRVTLRLRDARPEDGVRQIIVPLRSRAIRITGVWIVFRPADVAAAKTGTDAGNHLP